MKNDFSHPRWWLPVRIMDQARDEEKEFKKDFLVGEITKTVIYLLGFYAK